MKLFFYSCLISILFLPILSSIELQMYRDYKNSIKKGNNSELEFLKQQIIIEKQRLFE